MRSAAKTALLSGYVGAGAGLAGGIGQGLSGLGGPPSSIAKGLQSEFAQRAVLRRNEKSPAEAGP
jgi:hypothetical protein